MRSTISKKNWERAKDQFNDGITFPLICKASEDSLGVIDSFVVKHATKLNEAGMSATEAQIKTLGILVSSCMQTIHDSAPEYYTREIITNLILDIYDMIHMHVTDNEVFGDSNKKKS